MPEVVPQKHIELVARVMFAPIWGSRLLLGHCVRCGAAVRVNFELASKAAIGRDQVMCRDCAPPVLLDKGMVLTPRQLAGCRHTRS